MKNKIYHYLTIICLFNFFIISTNGVEQFNFNITDIEILENGRIFKSSNKGVVKANNGIVIYANSFEYDKVTNILNASGDVKMEDAVEDYTIFADNVTYLKDDEEVFTKGKTKSMIHSKYEIKSKNINFLINENILSSKEKTTIKDDQLNVYNLDEFKYFINKEELRGNNVIAITNFGLPKSDKIFFSSAIFNLKSKNFFAKDTKIKIHKDIFDNSDNDPRLKGVSSKKIGNIIIVNKGVFTSCKENENCPPWSIKAEEIKHDKNEKQILYKNAFLNIYDIPILYFPKFFHPDPTVKRQSGFLAPKLSSSDMFGRSITVPYFYTSRDDFDFTFTPTLFNEDIKMLQTEYRKVGKNYDLVTDFGYTNNYKSSLNNKKKDINHIFGKFNIDLGLENFQSSNLNISVEKVSNDTYLKVFDKYIITEKEILKPNNFDVLNSSLKFSLDHKNYNLESGFEIFEDLQLENNDRYQYIFPYYKFNKILSKNFMSGSVNMRSSGTNELKDTNNLRTRIINDTSYRGFDFISDSGVKNNFNINLKNLNSSGKNDSEYTSSPQIDLMSSVEFVSKLPLIKKTNFSENYITPKMSLRFNPSDMNNHSLDSRQINVNNIFANNRLGIDDSLESGRSLTLGIDYKKDKLNDINKYFEFSLATSIRDKVENNIPKRSTLNRKNSNLFGSMTSNLSKNLSLNYNFAIDNDLSTFDYNSVGAQLSINNFITEFSFIEENGEMGDANIIENNFAYILDESNQISFKTRRNRKINLTEYYNFVYEYKNDCLIAGLTFNKTYYEDSDLKPTEKLFFTVTIFPLTTYQTGNLKNEN
jgi:LPS-assembly protein